MAYGGSDFTVYRRIELSDITANCHVNLKFQSPSPSGDYLICTNAGAAERCKYNGGDLFEDQQIYIRCLHDRHLGVAEQEQLPIEFKPRYAAERAGYEVTILGRPLTEGEE